MKFTRLSLIVTAFLWTVASASTDAELDKTIEAKKATADSLQDMAEELEDQAGQLEDQLENIEDDKEDLKSEIRDQIEDLHEEIATIREKLDETLEDLKDQQDDIEDRVEDMIEEQERKRSGSFIVTLEYSHLDTDPLKLFLKNETTIDFNLTGNSMFMFGLMGYYNSGNDVRVGNGVYAGYKSFQSKTFSTTYYDPFLGDSVTVDSIATLRVIPAYIGFICEKAFVYEPVNFFAGIMLGGSMTVVVADKEETPGELFIDGNEDDSENDDHTDKKYPVLLAPAFSWDIHGGLAFTLSEHMHLGIDGVVRFSYAYEGFNGVNTSTNTPDFFSVSPGLRFRLTFGKAG